MDRYLMQVWSGCVEWGTDTIDVMIPHWCSIMYICRSFGSLASNVIWGGFHLMSFVAITNKSFHSSVSGRITSFDHFKLRCFRAGWRPGYFQKAVE